MTDTAPDKLIIDGIDGLVGSYDCDLVELITVGSASALTAREGHRIKQMTGIRAGELGDAFSSGDTDVIVALAAVVLARHGRQFDEDALWDAPMGRITFDVADRPGEDDAGPPAVRSGAGETPPTEEQSGNGGGFSSISLVSDPANGLRITGAPV